MKSYIPEWEKLRVIGSSKLVSMTIMVPFIGYLILFNNELVSYFTLSKELLHYPGSKEPIIDDTFSRLYFLYFGLTALGVSSIIFAFFCPTTIKNHKNVYEYLNNEILIKTYSRVHQLITQFEKILNKESKEYMEFKSYLNAYEDSWKEAEKICGSEGYVVVSEKNEEIEMDSFRNILSFNWKHHTNSQLYTRLVLTIGYAIGFLLVLYPSIQVFYKVTSIILIK